jgi:transposase
MPYIYRFNKHYTLPCYPVIQAIVQQFGSRVDTALTWALEIGDSSKQAISYCGLCGDETSSADTVMRMPISKQRNKHIQRVLVEAAKLAPRECHELAVIQ